MLPAKLPTFHSAISFPALKDVSHVFESLIFYFIYKYVNVCLLILIILFLIAKPLYTQKFIHCCLSHFGLL